MENTVNEEEYASCIVSHLAEQIIHNWIVDASSQKTHLNWNLDFLNEIIETSNFWVHSHLPLILPTFNIGFIGENYL